MTINIEDFNCHVQDISNDNAHRGHEAPPPAVAEPSGNEGSSATVRPGCRPRLDRPRGVEGDDRANRSSAVDVGADPAGRVPRTGSRLPLAAGCAPAADPARPQPPAASSSGSDQKKDDPLRVCRRLWTWVRIHKVHSRDAQAISLDGRAEHPRPARHRQRGRPSHCRKRRDGGNVMRYAVGYSML